MEKQMNENIKDFLLWYFGPQAEYESLFEYYISRILMLATAFLLLMLFLFIFAASNGMIAVIALGFYFFFKSFMYLGRNILLPFLKNLDDDKNS